MLLSKIEINANLEKLPDWHFFDISIQKDFVFLDFSSALEFVVKVGEQAEKIDHHPDIFLHSWNKVRITVSTHSAGGLTAKDFELASIIEKLKSFEA